jgi:hypothetical protein
MVEKYNKLAVDVNQFQAYGYKGTRTSLNEEEIQEGITRLGKALPRLS